MASTTEYPLDDLAALIRQSDGFLCVGHERPDGDAVGSVIALALALRAMAKRVVAALPDPVPDKYQFLPEAEQVTCELHGGFDIAFILDCEGRERLGDLAEVVKGADRQIVIDHHATTAAQDGLDWVDTNAAAVGVLILRLLDALQVELTAEIATNLYAAIATDTGFFRFENTNAEALVACGQCVEAGADPYEIAQRTNNQLPLAQKRLVGRALVNLELGCDGRAAISHLAPEDFAAAGASSQHADGVIDSLKEVAGVEVSVLLKADSDGLWRISLRSATIDVAAIASRFGGGGHSAAAGCELTGSLPQVTQRLLAAIAEALQKQGTQL